MRTSKAYNTLQAMTALVSRFQPGATSNAAYIHIGLFSGEPPTDDKLMSIIGGASSAATWPSTTLTPSENFLGDVALGSITPVMDFDNNILVLPFSAQANQITIAKSDIPTWFILRVSTTGNAADNWTGFSASAPVWAVVAGTVGDENSNADMKILGGAVTAGQPVRIADMRIKL